LLSIVQCGEIRELHVKTIDQKSYAQIEFVNKVRLSCSLSSFPRPR